MISGIVVAQGITARYLVKSNNAALKAMFGVQHNFKTGFTTELTKGQLKALEMLGVETEEVPLYHILGKPYCGDGKCHPVQEDAISCPEDCSTEPEPYCGDEICNGDETPETCPEDCSTEPEPERSCYPSTQEPYGIVKVNGGSGGLGVDVAVLDTGVYTDHLDLTRRIEQCKDFTKGPKVRNGCDDGYGHGTHVAGTVAADGGTDGLGIFGVAPEADIFAYKVCGNDGSCWTDDIAAAIDYAAANGAEIVSMSLGGDTQSSLIKNAIDRNPGVLYVAAAGNDGPVDGSIDYPGANAKVIAAGAIDSTEAVPDWSSRGINNGDYIIEEKEVEFGTPGVDVESTFNDGCYKVWSGTSMATPHVAGLAAKLWQGNAEDTRSYLQSIAKDIWITEDNSTTKDIDERDDTATGFGLPIAP